MINVSGKKSRAIRLCYVFLNVIEIYIPAIMLMCLFASFIVGIIFRYVFRNPQPWTFELSTIAFIQFVMLSACFVQREDEHIVFDMIYEKMSCRTQCWMRIISGIIVCLTSSILIPVAIKYVGTMLGLTTQILKWPRWCVFVSFPLTFIIIAIRSFCRIVLDVKSLFSKSYKKLYPSTLKEK